MIDAIFGACVSLLVLLADGLSVTCKAINAWIFVVIWPALTLALIAILILQQARIRRLLQVLEDGDEG